MASKFGYLALSFGALLATAAAGCGDAGQPNEPVQSERQALSSGIPWWLQDMPADWGCDQTLNGHFRGWDSAHMYHFPGKIGYRYTFSFDANYPAWKGAVIAVYDSETEDLVAVDVGYNRNHASVVYEAEKSIDYVVAVYSIAWTATGNYSLRADCELTKFCVEYETTAADGTPYNNFYAQNVTTYEEGKQVLAQVGDFLYEAINPGSCASQAIMCPAVEMPVCADTPQQQTQYGNVCKLKRHIREMAGETDQWKGHWEEGVCDATGQFCGGIAGFPCPDGFSCVLEGTYPDAGGSCQRQVCTYEGQGYVAGESFPAIDGCNACSCTDSGHVVCTKMACTCDPASEWWRDYKSTDPAMCEVMKFQCQPKTLYFGNGCGCGCEQDAACPEVFDCEPPATCDVAQIQSDCPYSTIAL